MSVTKAASFSEIEYRAWLTAYTKFRDRLEPICDKDVPTDPAALAAEDLALPKFLWAAERHKALAAMHHKQAQEAKASTAHRLWAKEDSAGLVNALQSRGFAVARHLKFNRQAYD